MVESKHYSGWIFASPSSPTWTQVTFKHKYKFQNPLRQNYKHTKAIQQLLDFVPSDHIHLWSCLPAMPSSKQRGLKESLRLRA